MAGLQFIQSRASSRRRLLAAFLKSICAKFTTGSGGASKNFPGDQLKDKMLGADQIKRITQKGLYKFCLVIGLFLSYFIFCRFFSCLQIQAKG